MVIFSWLLLQIIMPRRKFEKKRDPVNPENMKKAIEAITTSPDEIISIREPCKIYDVKFATLARHLNIFKQSHCDNCEYKARFDVNKVFSEIEEQNRVEYICTVSKM